ncbi:hypothetical protein AB0D34_21465 [Streptomyces sp. NPDC048420]
MTHRRVLLRMLPGQHAFHCGATFRWAYVDTDHTTRAEPADGAQRAASR